MARLVERFRTFQVNALQEIFCNSTCAIDTAHSNIILLSYQITCEV